MTLIRHSLQPFSPPPKEVDCSCSIERRAGVLHLDFTLAGELAKLVIPTEVNKPQRKDKLWTTTCFECFFKMTGSKDYWELNISPAGHWNLYHFLDYRQGMSTEKRVTAVTYQRSQAAGKFSLVCSFPIYDLVPQDCTIRLGLSSVLESKNGTKSYHALCHPGKQPDFHHQDGFQISLPPSC